MTKKEKFLKKIAKEFPKISWSRAKHITRGWDHDVIILDDSLVFRFPKSREYRNALQYEISFLKYLKRKTSIEIPQYNHIFKDLSGAGYIAVQGKELTKNRFRSLSISNKKHIRVQISSFLSRLHSVSIKIAGKHHTQKENQEHEYRKLISRTKKYAFSKLKAQEKSVIEKYFADLREAVSRPQGKVIAHNDLGAEHIFFDKKSKKVGVIDFSDRALMDPAIDFTGLLEYGPKFVKQVMEKYSGPKDPKLFQRAKLYFKRSALFVMNDSFTGAPCTFQEGYQMFKTRFHT